MLDTTEELTELRTLEREELTALVMILDAELLTRLERELLTFGRELLPGIDDGVLERLELTPIDELLHAPVTPKGAGCDAQVALEIQLLLFS